MDIPNIVYVVACIFLLLLFIPRTTAKAKRHKRYIKQSKEIRDTLLSFKGKNRNARIVSHLKGINPYIFEELCLTSLKDGLGFKVKRSKSYSGDGGCDGVVYLGFPFLNRKKWLIQAKCYSDYIKPQHVKEFSDLVDRNNCKGLFIHTAKTGDKSKAMKSSNVKIISGSLLARMILGTTNTFEITGRR